MPELRMVADDEDIDVIDEADGALDQAETPAGPRRLAWRGLRAYSWHAPRWLPAALVVGVVLWSGAIWWMASNLNKGDAAHPPAEAEAQTAQADELAVLRAKVDSLTQQTTAITQERESLAKRVAAIEARPIPTAAPAAASPTAASPTPAAQPAVTPVATVTMNLSATPSSYSIPHFAYLRTASSGVFPGAVPTRTADAAAATTTNTSRFFTNGADKYNCTSFGSQAEAQEALAANAPGDPNRLDMNGNGVACEDITYPANTPKNFTPVPNR